MPRIEFFPLEIHTGCAHAWLNDFHPRLNAIESCAPPPLLPCLGRKRERRIIVSTQYRHRLTP
jgi:hypothetical protein